MASKYSINNFIIAIINGNKYVLSKCMTEKMGIFNVLHDVKLKEDEDINISCDAKIEIIDFMLDVLIGTTFDVISISHLIEVITLMRYFTTNPEIIQNMSETYLTKLFLDSSINIL